MQQILYAANLVCLVMSKDRMYTQDQSFTCSAYMSPLLLIQAITLCLNLPSGGQATHWSSSNTIIGRRLKNMETMVHALRLPIACISYYTPLHVLSSMITKLSVLSKSSCTWLAHSHTISEEYCVLIQWYTGEGVGRPSLEDQAVVPPVHPVGAGRKWYLHFRWVGIYWSH